MVGKLKVTQTSWNLSPLFKSDNDPEMNRQRKEWSDLTNNFIGKWKSNQNYLKDPKILKEALDEYNSWCETNATLGNEGYYFHLRTAQDQLSPELKEKENKIIEFSQKLENEIHFFTLNIAKIPKEEQGKFLTAPELNKYKHLLKESFANAKYLLSEKEEKIMTLKSMSSYAMWARMVSEFISKEERVVLDENKKKSKKSFEEIMGLLLSQNKKVRDSAAAALNDIFAKHSDVAESEINAILYNKKIDDELRNTKRPDEIRHIADDIETETVDAMCEAVVSKFHLSMKFYELKAKLMKQKKLAYHERSVEFGKINKKYPYNESLNLVYRVFSDLDPKFAEILKKFNDEGRIDVYPKKGKTGGAFCTYGLKFHPTYVLLNHNNKLNDVRTLAHEMGHAIHGEFYKLSQPGIYCDCSTATAEVASTFMEDFVLEELLKKADEEMRLAILMQKLNSDVSSIMRQVACYRFEQDLHKNFREKGHLSKEDIGKLFQKNMSAYMGDYVEQSPGSENWWVYWSHIRNFFYVYSYASGLLISKSLQNSVKVNPKNIEKVKEYFSAGDSASAKDIFLKTGIDISKKEFWLQGLKEIELLLDETEALAKKLKKI